MSHVRKTKLWAAIVALGAATVFQVPGGCQDYYANFMVSSFDFCSVFNCSGGTYFDFCSPDSLFLDCPQVATTQP